MSNTRNKFINVFSASIDGDQIHINSCRKPFDDVACWPSLIVKRHRQCVAYTHRARQTYSGDAQPAKEKKNSNARRRGPKIHRPCGIRSTVCVCVSAVPSVALWSIAWRYK